MQNTNLNKKEAATMEFFKMAFCAKSAKLLRATEASEYTQKGIIEIVTGDKRGTIYIANMIKTNPAEQLTSTCPFKKGDRVLVSDYSSKEVKILKALVKAQNETIVSYRTGRSKISEKCFSFKAVENAKKFYGVTSISDIGSDNAIQDVDEDDFSLSM